VPVGHSYGGVLAWEFPATHWSENAKGLAIVDSAIERTPLPPDWSSFVWRRNVSGGLGAGRDSTAVGERLGVSQD
jgi:pimeloyl-ACP methyl ester carboxylesterase